MFRALIVVPDAAHPGRVLLEELRDLHSVYLVEGNGVLAVMHEEDGGIVYYGPGAWHSFTRGSAPLITQRGATGPSDASDTRSAPDPESTPA